MIRIYVTLILIAIADTAFAQNSQPLDIDYMLPGRIYAKSSIPDTTALGGFGGSDNAPKPIKQRFTDQDGLFLKVDTSQRTTLQQTIAAYHVYLGNKTDTLLALNASDSRLSIIAEVQYKGSWQPIEYLLDSWCGNSYHRVFLKPDEYWSFTVPQFTGSIPVQLRYRLDLGNDQYVYSNTIKARINKGQLSKKQEYTPNGIMDPYGN